MVSVILIAYNQRRYIRQAIESVLAQETSFPYELLIGDDASDDGTSDIVAEYARAYPDIIKAFIRPENVGAARNAVLLLQQARGELIASLEGDDYWIDPASWKSRRHFSESRRASSAAPPGYGAWMKTAAPSGESRNGSGRSGYSRWRTLTGCICLARRPA